MDVFSCVEWLEMIVLMSNVLVNILTFYLSFSRLSETYQRFLVLRVYSKNPTLVKAGFCNGILYYVVKAPQSTTNSAPVTVADSSLAR